MTLVAPADVGFRQLPDGMFDQLLQPENVGNLKQLLSCHLIDSAFSASDLPNGGDDNDGDPVQVKTVGGGILTFKALRAGGVSVTDEVGIVATVLYQDIPEANGMLQVIDTVMTPKTP